MADNLSPEADAKLGPPYVYPLVDPDKEEPKTPDPVKSVDFTPDEVQFAYEQHGGDAATALARMTAGILNNRPEFRGMANYDDIVLGTAPILDLVPLPRDAEGQALTDDQILRIFSSMVGLGEDGAPTETDAFLRGLTRGAGSLATGVVGAKLAASAAPPYVPIGPLGVLSKPAAGLFGFVTGSLIGDIAIGAPIANRLFTNLDDVVLTPKAEATFRSYESAGSVAPFVFMPFTAPRAMLNTASNLRKLPLANQVTVLSADDMANPLITQYLAGKVSGVPTTRQFTVLRDSIFKTAKEAGEDITLKQAAKRAADELNRSGALTRGTIATFDYAEKALVGAGKSFRELGGLGKAGVIGIESTAVPVTGALVNIQETNFPRDPAMRLGAEVVGSLAPSISILKHIPRAVKGSANYVRRVRENRALGKPLDLLGMQERAKGRAIEDIFEIFDDHGQDPDAFLKALEERMVDPVVKDGKVVSYKLKPEFQPEPGAPKTSLFSGQFIENPAIAQLEQTVLGRGSGGLSAKFEADFIKSMEMQKGQIFALRGTGDPQLMKVAGEMMQDRIATLIGMRTEKAVKDVVSAVQKIYPEGGADANRIIGERMKDVIKTQKELFRRLEKNAWDQVDRNLEFDTFYRRDPETGDLVEESLPNFVEVWDAEIGNLDKLEKDLFLQTKGVKELNNRILDFKRQLGLDATDRLAGDLPAVSRLDEALENAQGLPALDKYERVLQNAGVTDDLTLENIRRIGEAESRRGIDPKTADLLRLKRESLIALRAQQESAAATGVRTTPLTQGNLTALYSIARQVAREQGPSSDNFARLANGLAEATLDDLSNRPLGNPATDAARDISLAYNTYLRRAFGGDVLSKNAKGREFVNDALLTDKLMSGKPDAVALKIDQIQELGRQINKYASDAGYKVVTKKEVADYTGTTDEVLLDTLKLALREIEDPIAARTTRSPEAIALAQNEAMQQFRAKNPKIFEIFPQLGDMMDEAGDAASFLQRVQKTTDRLEGRVKELSAFKKLTGSENPERAVLAAINSDNPTRELNSLVELIKAGSNPRNLRRILRNRGYRARLDELDIESARKGARHAVLSLAFSHGGQYSAQGLNARGAYNMLFDKLPKADRESATVSQWMVNNNIMSEKEVAGLERGLRTIIQAETKQDVSQALLKNETPALLDMYTRILGSRIGTSVGSIMPGGRSGAAGLIEAEAGSRYIRQLTQEIPALQEYDALETILLDPELLAMALRKPRSPAEKKGIINYTLDKLRRLGIGLAPPAGQRAIPLGAQEVGEPEISSEPPPPPEPKQVIKESSLRLPSQPAAPTTSVASAAPVQPRPITPPPAASGPVDRSRYAAMFPTDIASGLIRQGQGIGSLMG